MIQKGYRDIIKKNDKFDLNEAYPEFCAYEIINLNKISFLFNNAVTYSNKMHKKYLEEAEKFENLLRSFSDSHGKIDWDAYCKHSENLPKLPKAEFLKELKEGVDGDRAIIYRFLSKMESNKEREEILKNPPNKLEDYYL